MQILLSFNIFVFFRAFASSHYYVAYLPEPFRGQLLFITLTPAERHYAVQSVGQ